MERVTEEKPISIKLKAFGTRKRSRLPLCLIYIVDPMGTKDLSKKIFMSHIKYINTIKPLKPLIVANSIGKES